VPNVLQANPQQGAEPQAQEGEGAEGEGQSQGVAFALYRMARASDMANWFPTGLPLTAGERAWFARYFEKCGQVHAGPFHVMQLAGNLIRMVANRAYVVGKDLMISAIPRSVGVDKTSGIVSGSGLWLGPDGFGLLKNATEEMLDKAMYFGYIPQDSGVPIEYTPMFVDPGNSVIGGGELATGPESQKLLERSLRRFGKTP
jgi:hypothetical protein